ncbi:acyl carrier protein [Hymenobacter convexus]|uniref:acyl carrier protein n=1 Tax=Hymenobacter sp. CA1UV-4 TaxID=3063782 RepID=UPI0027142AC6|nr:acyl carrier protein [Hymenobacter sp. CA1UV-4]MDO7854052.1 acyl carrier protein [Hymenobacter sp. CA1UV-4]
MQRAAYSQQLIALIQPPFSLTKVLPYSSTNRNRPSPLHEAASDLIKAYLPAGRPLTPTMHLRDEVGLDSLEFVELAMRLESRFRVTLPDEQIGKWQTVADVLHCLDQFVPQQVSQAV